MIAGSYITTVMSDEHYEGAFHLFNFARKYLQPIRMDKIFKCSVCASPYAFGLMIVLWSVFTPIVFCFALAQVYVWGRDLWGWFEAIGQKWID